MRRAILAGALFVMAMAVTAAVADTVFLTDGSKREGKILSSNDAEVVLEMTVGGMKAEVRIGRGQIARIEKGQTKTEALQQEFAKRKAALKAGDLDGMEALAKWAATNEMYAEATRVYEDMGGNGAEGFKRGKMGLSKMEHDRGRLAIAIVIAEELEKILTEDKEVAGWARQLRQERETALTEAVRNAMGQHEAGKPGAALQALEGLVDRMGLEMTQKAFAGGSKVIEGNPELLDYMATLRLARKCPYCREGRITCKECKGGGTTELGYLCPTCKGMGSAACSKCGGSGILWDTTPPEEREATAKALSKLAEREDAKLGELKKTLAQDGPAEDLRNAMNELTDHANRAETLRTWALGLKPETGLYHDLSEKRKSAGQLSGELLIAAAGRLDTAGKALIKEANAPGESTLRNDQKLRDGHELLQRAEACYRAVNVETVKLSEDPRKTAKDVHAIVAGVEQTLDRNTMMARMYDTAIAGAKANRLAEALKVMDELVTKAPKLDVEYLAEMHKKNTPVALPEFMAKMRFEIGKDKRHGFTMPTDYDKAAFVELLLSEAGGRAREAQQKYDNILDARAAGQGNIVSTAAVKNVQRLAEDARNWYETVLTIRYPLREATVAQVQDSITTMKHIIDKCKDWYTPIPAPRP